MLDDGDGERRALGRVGAGAELIEEDERAVVALIEDADDIRHVRGEGGEALLDALLIADVCHDLLEHGQARAVRCRNVQAALRHHGEQADRLERDGFAAGIRAGDDEGVKVAAERDVDRDDDVLGDQRMAGAPERDAALREHGGGAVEPVGQLRLGEDEVEPDEHVEIEGDVLAVRGAVGGELHEDALDLGLLLRAQFAQLVVRLDGGHRLDEERGAGAGHVVHEAGDAALVLGLDGNDIALGAHGDNRLLQRLGVARRGDDLLQRVVHPCARGADQAADGGELRRRGVRNLVLAHDGAGDLVLEELVRLQGGEHVINAGALLLFTQTVGAHGAGSREHARNIEQLARVQHAAHVRALQRRAHVLDAGKRGAAGDDHHLGGGARLVQTTGDLGAVAGGDERSRPLARGAGDGLGREQLQHGRQLQRAEGFHRLFFHTSFTFFQ